MRKLLAVIAGVIAGALVAAVVEALGHQVYPPQAGMDTTHAGAPFFVIGGLAVGAFAAGWAVARLAHEQGMFLALIAGGILLAGAVANLAMQPQPLWIMITAPLIMLPMTALGARLGL